MPGLRGKIINTTQQHHGNGIVYSAHIQRFVHLFCCLYVIIAAHAAGHCNVPATPAGFLCFKLDLCACAFQFPLQICYFHGYCSFRLSINALASSSASKHSVQSPPSSLTRYSMSLSSTGFSLANWYSSSLPSSSKLQNS